MKLYTFFKKSIPFALAIFSSLTFTSCQKDNPPIFKDKGGKSGNPLVFVAGYELNGANTAVAKYWINDQAVTLSNGTNDAQANSIFVAGNDAYIAGYDGGPVYWKNITEIPLPIQSISDKINSSANSIYVSGGHIYIAGQEGTKAVYWKDGTEIMLNTTDAYGHSDYSIAKSVFISGNDIYVAGLHGANAVYWKNGVEVYLSTIPIDLSGIYGSDYANSIYVLGGNVYVVGSGNRVGALANFGFYWKNGIDETSTLDRSNFFNISDANSVFVSGNKVYISGIGFNNSFPTRLFSAVYWNNGIATILSDNGINAFTSDIYVKGNDVYVSGYENNNNNNQTYAVYWKNGTEVKLTDGTRNAVATSIFIR